MTRILIEEDPHRPGEGCARLLIPGMGGRTAQAVTFTREGFGADSLGPDGWQVAAGHLTPIEIEHEGATLILVLGPEAAEHLQPGPVRLGIAALNIDQVVIWPDIPPALSDRRDGFGAQRTGARGPRRIPPRQQPKPKAAKEEDATVVIRAAPPPPPPTPIVQPPPAPPILPPETQRPASRLPLIAALLVLLAAGGGAAWWFWPAVESAPPPTPPVAVDPTENATVAEIAAMNLPPERIMAIAGRRQATNRHGDALLLLELAAERRHPPALAALARLYDPATFTRGGALSQPNPIKAAELWREAERAGDTSAPAARAALRQALENAARNGDTQAALALRDFWP